MDKTDAKYAQSLTVNLSRPEWGFIRDAVETAAARSTEARFTRIIPGARLKIGNALKEPGDRLAVEASVLAWIDLSELILAFGNCYAKTGGAEIVAKCSEALYRKGTDEEAA